MSISSALSNALAGLQVSSKRMDIIATNVSNATTPGFSRRSLEVSATSGSFLGGVTATGITRHVDPVLLAGRRDAQADLGYATVANTFFARLESELGTPDDPMALTNLIADFDARLLEASSRPDSTERLDAVLNAAQNLVQAFNAVSREISNIRTEAEATIDVQVNRLNAALEEVENLNSKIASVSIRGGDDSALRDMRKGVIDEINEIVPVREAARENGGVALYSHGGIILIGGPARVVDFDKNNLVTPYKTLAGGQLNGLAMGSIPLPMDSAGAVLPGGSLAAQFAIRDELGVDAMAQIDAAARHLVERFQDPAVDPTLLPGDAGLFTDSGLAFAPIDEVGLAERISLNPMVDPNAGGELWRLRDGIGAVTPGAVGQSAILDNLRGALEAPVIPASGDFGTGSVSMSGLANSLMSRLGVQRLTGEQSLTFATAAFNEMSLAEQSAGVDTDAEIQNMILVEQVYTANARLMQVIEDMLDQLMRIGQ